MEIARYHPVYDPDIDRLCEKFSQQSLGEYGLATNKAAVESIKKAVKDHSFLLIAGDPQSKVGKKCVGVIAGYYVAAVGSDRPALQEVIWYVEKEYRSNGLKLLERFEEYAKEIGASMIVMVLMKNSMEDKLDALYRKLGYKPFEVQYMKEL